MLNFLMAAFDNLTPMNWDVIKPALNFLWQGLLAIFVVIGLIIIVVKLSAFAITKSAEAKAKREAAANEQENTDNNP
ncbi:MAG: hypothetical protein E7366_00605 [Clostridiales bacterium]|jgi:hypothetical protein|nr:hypothetical protein [Clostridiales bacterium]